MNNIKIVGYSERGAMNALFYGIALNKDEKAANEAMNEFLHMAGETETFQDFELYSEFSLSGFGDPDLVITAKNELGKTIVFFIEAKASAGGYYELDEQKSHHEEYLEDYTKYNKIIPQTCSFNSKKSFFC